MDVIGHDVEPVNVFLKTIQIEAAQVPITSWNGNGQLPPWVLAVKGFTDVGAKQDQAVVVLRRATAVTGNRILPVYSNLLVAIYGLLALTAYEPMSTPFRPYRLMYRIKDAMNFSLFGVVDAISEKRCCVGGSLNTQPPNAPLEVVWYGSQQAS